MRLAVVHEWISSRAGSEQVFEAMAAMWPEADLFALSRDPAVEFETGGRAVTTTLLDRPRLRDSRGLTLPLMPLAWRALGGPRYDWALTSHHAFASANRLADRQLVYVHSPARYVWSPDIDERGRGALLAAPRAVLKRLDRATAARIEGIAANSAEVAGRIERYWGRSAEVIHPPVDTTYFTPAGAAPSTLDLPDDYLLGLGRWIPYKNHELIIAIGERAGLPVVLAGHGPLEARLRARAQDATVPVLFHRSPPRADVRELLQRATALVFPTKEDFGLVPVEAMACGTPVIAAAAGGALETVEDGRSGVLVSEPTVQAYVQALDIASGLAEQDCVEQAGRFSRQVFESRLRRWTSHYFDTGIGPLG